MQEAGEGMEVLQELGVKDLPKLKRAGILLVGMACFLLVIGIGNLLGVPEVKSSYSDFGIAALCVVAVVFSHEGLHGAFFRKFGGKVKFGFKLWTPMGPVFYTTAPGCLFTKAQALMTVLAPQIMTPILLGVIAFAPDVLKRPLLLAGAFNLAGGCFDIYIANWLRVFPADVLIEDTVTGLKVYKGGTT